MLALIALLVLVPGCALVRMVAGADIDPERFTRAREAVVLEQRHRGALELSQRLVRPPLPEQSDVLIRLSPALLNKAARALHAAEGALDADTRYIIDSVAIALGNGSAVASLALRAHNTRHGVDVDLVMDCLMVPRLEDDDIVLRFEPFAITPVVRAGGMLSAVEDVIRDILKVRLARIGTDVPPLRFPVDLRNVSTVPAGTIPVRGPVNLDLGLPPRSISTAFRLREVLVLEQGLLIGIEFTSVEVK